MTEQPKALDYLKRFSKKARKTPDIPVLPEDIRAEFPEWNGAELQQVESYLLAEGYIEKTENTDGGLQKQRLTSKGIRMLRRHTIRGRIWNTLGLIVKSIGKSEQLRNILYAALIAIFLYSIRGVIETYVFHNWMKHVAPLIDKNAYLYLAITVLFVVVLFKSYGRKVTTGDWVVLAVYLYYSNQQQWNFWTFGTGTSFSLRFIDLVPVYYGFLLIVFPLIPRIKYFWYHPAMNDKHLVVRYEWTGRVIIATDNSLKNWRSRSGMSAMIDLLRVFFRALFFRTNTIFSDGILFPDMPIEKEAEKDNTSDLSKYDKLGRFQFAAQIADVIETMRPYKAFAIGINGPWGSGKTSLISLIKNRLQQGTDGDQIIFIEFFPWFFTDTESLIKNFFSLLENEFRQNRRLANELRAYAEQIAAIEEKFFDFKFSQFLLREEPGLNERYDRIIEEIQIENRLLVISIDDLDRLDKKEVIDTLRLIRLLADFPNTFYIVGYDRGYINAAIKKHITDYNPDKYIDKVFNIEFKVPEMADVLIRDRLEGFIAELRKKLSGNGIVIADEQVEQCLGFNELDRFIENERDIRRFTNNLGMRFIAVTGEVSFYQFFLLELLNYKYPEVHKSIYVNHAEVTEYFRVKHSPEVITDDALVRILRLGKLNDEVLNILDILFSPSNIADPNAFANELYYHRYYTLSLLNNQWSQQEFDSAFGEEPIKLLERLRTWDEKNPVFLRKKLSEKTIRSQEELQHALVAMIDWYALVNDTNPRSSRVAVTTAPEVSGLLTQLYFNASCAEKSSVLETAFAEAAQPARAMELLPAFDSDKMAADGSFEQFRQSLCRIFAAGLRAMIQKSNGVYSSAVINTWRNLHTFVFRNADDKRFDWYRTAVLLPNARFVSENLKELIAEIRTSALNTKSEIDAGSARKLIESIFHNDTGIRDTLNVEYSGIPVEPHFLEDLLDLYFMADREKEAERAGNAFLRRYRLFLYQLRNVSAELLYNGDQNAVTSKNPEELFTSLVAAGILSQEWLEREKTEEILKWQTLLSRNPHINPGDVSRVQAMEKALSNWPEMLLETYCFRVAEQNLGPKGYSLMRHSGQPKQAFEFDFSAQRADHHLMLFDVYYFQKDRLGRQIAESILARAKYAMNGPGRISILTIIFQAGGKRSFEGFEAVFHEEAMRVGLSDWRERFFFHFCAEFEENGKREAINAFLDQVQQRMS